MKIVKYWQHVLVGLVALPISLLIVTSVILLALLALPLLWFIIILWWVNDFKTRMNRDPNYVEEEEIFDYDDEPTK